MLRTTLALILIAFPLAADADQASADKCATRLAGDPRAIYDATVLRLTPGADLRNLVKGTTRSLAMAGTIDRGGARGSAESAGACLKLIR